jgi:glutamate carboxypeptidase
MAVPHRRSSLSRLRDRRELMVDHLAALVTCESPSDDIAATARCAGVVSDLGHALVDAEPVPHLVDGRTHLVWRWPGPRRILLLGHLDTVWETGTLARLPFDVSDSGIARGPGCFDMKAGIVQLFHALSVLDDLAGVSVLITSDEEIGSGSSRDLIEAEAADADAVLVLEPSAAGGALKTSRKGTSSYEIRVTGRAAHAGLDPTLGANATVELAHQVFAVGALERPETGTTATPTVMAAGSTANTVPATGSLHVDIRCATLNEQHRIDREIRALGPRLRGTSLSVEGGPNRPPMVADRSMELFALCRDVAGEMGLPEPSGSSVGGASDGNFTAALGVPTLDGLGAVGGGAHADDEHVVVAAMPDRAALVCGLVRALAGR